MSSGSADRVRARPEELEALASKVALVRRDLDAGIGFDGYDEGIRSALIEDALHDFHSGWSDRRGDLVELLRSSEAVLQAAAQQFRDADSSLASAFDEGGGPSSGRRPA